MRRDPTTGRSVPETLGETLTYFEGEFDEKVVGGAERKGDVLDLLRATINFSPEGARTKINPNLSFDEFCGQLIIRSAAFASARIREHLESQAPNDMMMETARIVILTGDKVRMRKFAEQLRKACLHPAVHPEKHTGLKRLAAWVEMNADGNC